MLKIQVSCVLAICVGLLVAAQAQSPPFPGTFPQGIFTNRAALDASGFSPSCSQSSTFLAATSGLSNTDKSNYDTMICGMVTDGTFSLLDTFYVFTTNTTTTAKINIATPGTFNLTYNGTPSESSQFSAFNGYTGDGSTVYLDTTFIPPGNYTEFANSFGSYVLTSRTSTNTSCDMGDSKKSFGARAYMCPLFNATGVLYCSECNAGVSGTNSNARGAYAISRTSSSVANIYKNGSATSLGTDSVTVNEASDCNWIILAIQNDATNHCAIQSNFTTDQIAAAWIGGAMTSTQAVAMNNRINTFMTAYGVNAY